jgi:hypothetical protein
MRCSHVSFEAGSIRGKRIGGRGRDSEPVVPWVKRRGGFA